MDDDTAGDGDKILDLLAKGREYFATHEWNRNGQFLSGDTCCGMGALIGALGARWWAGAAALAGHDTLTAAEGALVAAAGLQSPWEFYRFNDRFAKSKEDVLAVFDRAIEARRIFVGA